MSGVGEYSEPTIWFPALCGNATPRDAFWNPDITVNTEKPDLTDCFQSTALSWLPCAVLILATPFFIAHYYDHIYRHAICAFSCMNATKIIFCIAIMITRWLDLLNACLWKDHAPVAQVIAPLVYIATLGLVIFLTRYEFRKGEHSSGTLFCFWLLMLISSLAVFYSQLSRWLEKTFTDELELYNNGIFFGLVAFQFSIHLFADHGALSYRYRRSRASGRQRAGGDDDAETKPLLAGADGDDEGAERRPLLADSRRPPHHSRDQAATYLTDLRTKHEESPELYSSFLASITYTWTSGLLLMGYKRKLDGDTLWDLNETEKSTGLVRTFYRNWCLSSKDHKFENSFEKSDVINVEDAPNGVVPDYTHMRSKRHVSKAPERATWQLNSSIVSAIIKSFGRYYILIGIYEIFNIILTFVRPLIQDQLIGYVSDDSAHEWQGFVYAFSLFGITILRALINQQHFYGKMITGMRVRGAVTAAVYRKALLLAGSARKNYSVGEIVNLMAVDAQRMGDATFFLHNLWSAPVNIVVAMVLLWQYLGVASLAGLAVLLVLIFINTGVAAKVKKLQVQQMKYKDERTRLTSEILNGIKVLKLYAWEEAFDERLCEIRDLELSFIQKSALYFSGTVITFSCAPVLFAVISFTVYMFTSGDSVLSASVAFVSLSLLSSLTRPLAFLPNGIANIVQAQVSIKRLDTYLNGEELDPDLVQETKSMKTDIEITNGTFAWDEHIERPVLRNVNIRIERGSLTAIVGQVGSGKSSMLASMLGELQRVDGDIYRAGSIAFVPQEAWIRNQTLERNVLFGQPMDRTRYEKALDSCALGPDLHMLTAGDQTEIGERGINLSGGQKARVSLARAVYQNRDIYLLDDPLSAVDSHVGKHIYNEVIGSTGVLGKKTRVLVTHGITYLPKMDQIIVMKDGQVSECGSYQQLISHNGAFAEFIRSFLVEEEGVSDEENEIDDEEKELIRDLQRQLSTISAMSGSVSDDLEMSEGSVGSVGSGGQSKRKRKISLRRRSRPQKEAEEKKPEGRGPGGRPPFGARRLIDAEGLATGGVKWDVLIDYLRAVGWTLVGLIGATIVAQIASDLAGNIWLAEWSGDEARMANNETLPDNLPDIRVGVYGGIGALQTISVASQSVLLAVGCVIASRVLHKKLLVRILQAPMSFFDTTPVGRILNRFSNDMVTVDASLRMTLVAGLRGVSSLITTIIAITYTAPIFLVIIIPLGVAYYFIQRFYIMSSNQIRRLMNVRTSPIYSHFGESVSGATTIRAYHRQRDFVADSDELVDYLQMARYPSIVINRWLSVWLECLGGFVVLFAGLFAVLAKGNITGGLVGLSISYALQVTDRLAMFLRNTSDLENNIVSVERIREYSNVDQEAPWHVEGETPPPDWPAVGGVRFNDYSTRYRPGLDLILHQISATFQGGEKIGIVGRTGAGKSSMTLSLFRIIEPADGAIVIDDITTGRIGLHDLRTKITIIPQDPVLFSGTLRFNLDPFNERGDDEVWDALGHAHLKNFVASLPAMLQHQCTEGGSNLSVGQRQLVCLARALLRKTRILVLDEATAAIDLETDNLIQSSIRSEFADCTVITIAHRINTVMDYDKILVMDAGRVAEFDTPNTLLANTDSIFYGMCKNAGIVS